MAFSTKSLALSFAAWSSCFNSCSLATPAALASSKTLLASAAAAAAAAVAAAAAAAAAVAAAADSSWSFFNSPLVYAKVSVETLSFLATAADFAFASARSASALKE